VAGDDMTEPVADEVRSILDGHIVLSRDLAAQKVYPAIDILQSISRVMPAVASREHRDLAEKMRGLMAEYSKNEDPIRMGLYQPGSNPGIDEAVQRHDAIQHFLCQRTDERISVNETLKQMRAVLGG